MDFLFANLHRLIHSLWFLWILFYLAMREARYFTLPIMLSQENCSWIFICFFRAVKPTKIWKHLFLTKLKSSQLDFHYYESVLEQSKFPLLQRNSLYCFHSLQFLPSVFQTKMRWIRSGLYQSPDGVISLAPKGKTNRSETFSQIESNSDKTAWNNGEIELNWNESFQVIIQRHFSMISGSLFTP